MEQSLTPPPSGRLVAPVWTQWPLSPRLTKNVGSKQKEENDLVEGSKFNGSAPTSTALNDSQKEQTRLRQLRLLSPVPIEQKHENLRRTRHPETCSWLFTNPDYDEWVSLDGSAVLCCYGPPGCGKTVLTSSAADDLLSSESEDIGVAYYYCDYADKVSLEPSFILGTLVRELLQGYEIPEEVRNLIGLHYRDGGRTPETGEVFQILLQTVYWFQSVILIVDGIDEVDEADRNTVLKYLKTLMLYPGLSVKVFITSRDDTDVLSVLSPLSEICFRVNVPDSAGSNGIYCYVRDSVQSMVYAKRLAINPSNLELKDEVVQKLSVGAKGIFLWAKLQLGSLCLAGREESIRAALQDLPKDLDETYDRHLKRLARSESQVLIRRMFECILAARRPLSMEELCEGMAFTMEDRCWDATKIPVNDVQVISSYGGLVVFDEITKVVQLAHYTVYKYLLRDRPTSCYQFNIKDANQHLGELCLAYLFFDDFKVQVPPNNGIASPVSPADTIMSSTDVSSITIGFRQSLPPPPATPHIPASFEKFSLLRYARKNWLWHAARFTQNGHPTKRDILFQHLLVRKQLPFQFKPWPARIFHGNPYPDLVGWAIVNNNPTLINSLAEFDHMFNFKGYIRDSINSIFKEVVNNSISSQQQESFAATRDTWNENIPMHSWMYSKMLIACRRGNLAILNLCRLDLDKEARPWDQFRAHLILEAAATNQNAIIDSFNFGQRRPNNQIRSFTTAYAGQLCNALERAALAGHTDMVRKLGRAGWSANIFGSDPSTGILALHNAILGNNSDVVEALLAALEITIYDPSQPFSQDDSRLGIKTAAFCKAASSGYMPVVNAFLADGASPIMADESGMNPYMQAIKDGRIDVFASLFPLPGCGIEKNVTGLPLAMAAANGRTEIVEFLISKGADVFPSNGPDNSISGLDQGLNMTCPTPLYAASANGHCTVIEKLLAAGAGADVISARDLLLESDGTGRDRSRGLYSPEQEPPVASGTIQLYQRPLSGAALNGQFRVVQLLLKAQALVNPRDLSENSPLLLALIGGHAEVANLLSSKGAEILNKESAEQALLSCSMGQGGPKALELLIEHGVSPNCVNFMGESCLDIATTAGLTDIMKELIEAGADVNTRDHLSQTSLMRACSAAQFRAAWILVNSGANLSMKDRSGNSALSFASVCGDPQIVQLLLDNGAPVDSPNLVRQTPLLEACLSGDEATVKLLLAYGANVHARTGQTMQHKSKRIPRGSTPLMIATIMNEPSIILSLCESGQGVEDIEFEQRRTSLLLAAENGQLATFKALVKGGASLKARNSANLSALDLAVRGGNVEVIDYLTSIHKQELKTKNGGLLSADEISSAIKIAPKAGPLPIETISKLKKLEPSVERPESCVSLVDPLEELFGW